MREARERLRVKVSEESISEAEGFSREEDVDAEGDIQAAVQRWEQMREAVEAARADMIAAERAAMIAAERAAERVAAEKAAERATEDIRRRVAQQKREEEES